MTMTELMPFGVLVPLIAAPICALCLAVFCRG